MRPISGGLLVLLIILIECVYCRPYRLFGREEDCYIAGRILKNGEVYSSPTNPCFGLECEDGEHFAVYLCASGQQTTAEPNTKAPTTTTVRTTTTTNATTSTTTTLTAAKSTKKITTGSSNMTSLISRERQNSTNLMATLPATQKNATTTKIPSTKKHLFTSSSKVNLTETVITNAEKIVLT
ncbi:integumentary mucin C.1-like [Hydractinia symbiolongicarpus]|uniref:integumentary mucin C.1-like n=1 Tax=Hydractinia symbiolongicarpus TaxID=13093 RepID=UPI00254B1612|nr:integumentary mucin C.1-like [Hydractinia symbiolongicarpus]